MSNTQKDSKLVVVKTPGVLKELGYITGPIIHPSRIKLAKIVNMVNNGKVVFEVNPKNQEERVQLTRLNVTHDNFSDLPSAPEKEEKVEKIADTSGKTAEIAGLGTLDRRVIDPTYTPATDTAATVETTPANTETKAEEVNVVETVSAESATEGEVPAVEETTEDESVAEEESSPEASSNVETSQSDNSASSFQNYYGKKNKKNRNKNNGSNFTAQ